MIERMNNRETDRQTAEGRLCPRGSQNIPYFNYSLVECCSMNECIRMNSEWTRLCLLILRFLQLEPAALEQTVSFRLTLAQITLLVEASTSIPGLLVHYPPSSHTSDMQSADILAYFML